MSQIYLFTGENTFLLRQERTRWIEEFTKKHGEENCARLDGQKLSIRALLDEVSVLPFLAEKRLVIVDAVPRCTREDVQALPTQIHPQVLLLFCDPKPDKRITGVKELLEVAELKTFAPLRGMALSQWIRTFAAALRTSLTQDAEHALIEFLGEDMELLSQEVEKLAMYAAGRAITRADVELMTIPSDEGIVWKMTDLLCAGNRIEALSYARRMLGRGGDPWQVWNILLSHLKNLVLVRSALDANVTSPKAIAEKTGVHIFALRNLQPYAQSVKHSPMRSLLAWAVRSERDLKTGVLKSTDEAPQELHALIEQCILKSP